MFKTDGSVHFEGIANELNTIELLNNLNIFTSEVKPLGGTKNKADAIVNNENCEVLGISIKRKKNIKTGSYDYINTSKCDIIKPYFEEFLNFIKYARELNTQDREDLVDIVREKFNNISNTVLDNLSQVDIKNILNTALVTDHQDIDTVVINETDTSTLFVFSPDNHPAISYMNNNYSVVLVGSGSSSRKVLFVDSDGNNYDCGLRLRVVNNNGIRAFLGLSKSNKNSQVVIKLQQDKVNKLLSQVGAITYTY